MWTSSPKITSDTSFPIASVGKTMTAVAVLRLVAGGDLSLEDKTVDWVSPNISDGLPDLDNITIRHLLTMSSGLPDYYTWNYVEDALDDPGGTQLPEAALSYVFDEPLLFPPGTAFDYSNTNYVLLGLILEAASAQSYGSVMETEVFAPARMTDSFVFGTRPLPANFAHSPDHDANVARYYSAQGFGDGGVISTAADLARFYTALFLDRTLLPADLLRIMTTDDLNEGYGMGIEVEDGILGHSGADLGFSSDVRLHPASATIAIELIAAEDAGMGWAFDQMPD